MSWVYGVGYVTSIAMGLMIIGKLIRLAKGEFKESDLIQVTDSEEDAKPHMQEAAK
jgi:TRAP-type C4-dicarboxylate transport system permease small subunit